MQYWTFQANPKYSNIKDAICKLDSIYWLVTRYTKEIKPSDNVLIWIAGKDAGIYATAKVIDTPSFMDEPPDIDIWTMPIRAKGKFYAPVKFTQKLLDKPLLKNKLQFDSVLYKLQVIQRPFGTNFSVTHSEWERVQELIMSV
ncbi:hypothetical protein NIES2101_07085 [Calothrix sp. HK-06]|nr:hypothetical protein NIES2101_07085 [Calothrix sp. HK-06]